MTSSEVSSDRLADVPTRRVADSARRVVIVGGGITGLAAAYYLAEGARREKVPVEVTLVEAGPRVGGVIHTWRQDGFLIEGGSDSFITNKPWAPELCRELGLESKLVATDSRYRRTFVVRRGKLREVPEGFVLLAPSRIWPVLKSPVFSWRGKLRMGLDLALPRGAAREDESLGEFVTRRLGREALERVVQPLVAGIYTADPAQLSLRATMPQFLEMERAHRSLILGSRARRRQQPEDGEGISGARYGLFVTVDTGLETLVDELVRRLPEGTIRKGVAAAQLIAGVGGQGSGVGDQGSGIVEADTLGVAQEQHRGCRPSRPNPPPQGGRESFLGNSCGSLVWHVELADGSTWQADAVILAVPAYAAAVLVGGFDAELRQRLEAIPYASAAIVHLGYRREQVGHPLDGFGIVVPAIEGRAILACSFSSVKFPGRAPDGHMLFRVFLGGALQPEVLEQDDAALGLLAQGELGALLGIAGRPVLCSVSRHWRSMPQYLVGHLERVSAIEDRLARWPGLYLAGNAYRGVGIPDCIRSGREAAERVLKTFGQLAFDESAVSGAQPARAH